jgi:hypothetical protein
MGAPRGNRARATEAEARWGPDDLPDLSAVYAKFVEGFEAPDLQPARDLSDRNVPASSHGVHSRQAGAPLLP